MQNQDLITAITTHFDRLVKSNQLTKDLSVAKGLYTAGSETPRDLLNITWSETKEEDRKMIVIDSCLVITIESIAYCRRYHDTPNLRYLGSEQTEYDWTDPQLLNKLEALIPARPISSEEKQ